MKLCVELTARLHPRRPVDVLYHRSIQVRPQLDAARLHLLHVLIRLARLLLKG